MIPESVQDLYLIDTALEGTVVVPGNVEEIAIHSGDAAVESNIENIILMDGITKISNGAFQANYLTSLEIPSTVTSIGKDVFIWNEDLTEIVVRGKTSAPATFDENWNCKNDECSERYNVVFRP